jgi:hypothetical protein
LDVLTKFLKGDGSKIKGMLEDAIAMDVTRPPVVQSKPDWVSIATHVVVLGAVFAAGYAVAQRTGAAST